MEAAATGTFACEVLNACQLRSGGGAAGREGRPVVGRDLKIAGFIPRPEWAKRRVYYLRSVRRLH